jgi:diguanylate cyclase (GGDEF)-like protein/PAS domain S-box-containing protein
VFGAHRCGRWLLRKDTTSEIVFKGEGRGGRRLQAIGKADRTSQVKQWRTMPLSAFRHTLTQTVKHPHRLPSRVLNVRECHNPFDWTTPHCDHRECQMFGQRTFSPNLGTLPTDPIDPIFNDMKKLRNAFTGFQRSLVKVAVVMLFTMTLYESVKQYLLPKMTIWTSHAITIVFTTIGATAIAYVLIRAREALNARLTQEAEENRMAQLQLEQQLQFTEVLSDAIPSPVFFKNSRNEYLGCNAAFEAFTGLRRDQIVAKTAFDLWPRHVAQVVHEADLELMATGTTHSREVPMPHADGTMRNVIYQKAAYRDRDGNIAGQVGILVDITVVKRAELTITRQKDFLSALIDNLPVGVFVKDARNDYRFTLWNSCIEQEFGLTREEILGKNDYDFFAKDEADSFRSIDEQVMRDKKVVDVACEKVTSRRGEILAHTVKVPLHWGDGEPDTLLGIVENITDRKKNEERLALYQDDLEGQVAKRTHELETTNVRLRDEVSQRREAEKKIKHLAYYDVLTDLPNRTLLQDRISQALQSARRHKWSVAILYIDLDQFKNINDPLGHEIGDKMLRAVGERLLTLVRKEDTVARLGGDEFALLLPNIKDSEHGSRVAEKVLVDMKRPYLIGPHELHISASIGISVFPGDGADAVTLIRNADGAMYKAKSEGRNGYAFFTPEMTARALETLRTGNEMRHAIDRKEFILHYQPQIDLATGRIIGAEALIRWQHPELGLIYPAKFIRIAEETGLIEPIGAWVLQTACRQNKAWQRAGFPTITMAVNLSARQFHRNQIEGLAKAVLAETELDPACLELELTESMVMHNADQAIAVMQALKTIGVRLSIDDFGTGYSSLSYLKRFPIDKLKVDQSFVRDLGSKRDNNAAIVDAIIALAKSLNLKVIAEGVETKEQLEALKSKGCDEVQGYYFSRPVTADAFEQLLQGSDQRQGSPFSARESREGVQPDT